MQSVTGCDPFLCESIAGTAGRSTLSVAAYLPSQALPVQLAVKSA